MHNYLCFGSFRFEPSTARLWQDKDEIKLTRKAAAVLGLLLDRAGQPVTKEDLFAFVWRNSVVSDDALVTCIQELRKALSDDAKHPLYIQTRHRSGYLFVADVSNAGDDASDGLEVSERVTGIAVLPFVDMSPDRDQDYFCEGLAEELIDALTQVGGLRVAARSSSFQFGAADVQIREIGRRLGVQELLQGSVRKAGDRLRITVQLIDVHSGYHRWSQRFEANVGDVFAVQDEIADAVATTLRGGSLSHSERRAVRRPQTSAEPYEYFLRGRQRLHRMQQPDMDESRRLFERAIALDAKYAPAWAGLATVHALLFEWWGARDEDLQYADRASQRAMELAPDMADAHVARGCALSLYRRYEEAQTHFEAAARINPNLFDAYYYHGRAAFSRGELERSAELFRKASEVRREDFQSSVLLSQSLRMLGRIEEASSANREGISRAERILTLNPLDGRVLALGSLALYEAGEMERAMEWSRRSLELRPDDMSALLNAVCLRAKSGLKEEALELLERACNRGWGKRDWIDRDPDYDSLRDDPRFELLLAKLK
ncbi:MAG TPA: winged helix-turn-helix domain-containing protein [Candidatus Acidoferrum sp.]|nr:winged helix-turn-helix domain-containing protein [Candidatus Acidoferrum sp.]